MTMKHVYVLLVSLLFTATSVMAAQGGGDATPKQPLQENLILWMFGGGIAAITISWLLVPYIFASRGKLDDLVDLLRHGTVMRFVTVTYIVIVVVTLAMVDRLDSDKVSTLLASIAGYVLGQATAPRERERGEEKAPQKPAETQLSTSMVRPDGGPRPTYP